jgi:hypothetical protein
MEQHLAGLARPADRLPVDLVEMAHLAGQMIAPRGLARGVESAALAAAVSGTCLRPA